MSTLDTIELRDDTLPRVRNSDLLPAESPPQIQPPRVIVHTSLSESSRNQQRLEDFGRLSGTWFWEMDENLKYSYVSDRFSQITGIPENLVLDMTIEEIGLMEDDPHAWYEHRTDLKNHRSFRNFVFSRIHPDGRGIAVSINGDPLFDPSGAFLGYRGTGTEITNRVEAEDALLETRALLDSYFAAVPAGMALVDSEMRYVKVNSALAEINGLSIEDHLHKRPSDILPGSLGVDIEDKYNRMLQTGQSMITEEISGETPSQPGVLRNWLVSYFPISGVQQLRSSIGVIVLETTGEKSIEDHFRQAQKMDSLRQLSGGVAHDFNNLLTVILGDSSLLQGRLLPEDELLVREIIHAGNRGAELTRQLLRFSRQQSTQPVATDINSLVSKMSDLLRRTLGTMIVIETTLAPVSMRVMVDPNLVESAILNIALNARDAMPDGGTLAIRTIDEPAPGPSTITSQGRNSTRQVSIVIEDDGTGMTPDVLSHALDPFFTTKKSGVGSGLGLSMVLGFARKLEGDLIIESMQGKGTKVTLSLPCMVRANSA